MKRILNLASSFEAHPAESGAQSRKPVRRKFTSGVKSVRFTASLHISDGVLSLFVAEKAMAGFRFARAALGLAVGFPAAMPLVAQTSELHLAQGALAGEVTQTTAILQSRLTAVPELTGGDVAGAAGTGRFEIATNESFRDARQTPWLNATAEADFILKAYVDGLQPATTYYYRVVYG